MLVLEMIFYFLLLIFFGYLVVTFLVIKSRGAYWARAIYLVVLAGGGGAYASSFMVKDSLEIYEFFVLVGSLIVLTYFFGWGVAPERYENNKYQ